MPSVRAARLLQMLLLLQARGPTTAAELAAELEVSARTVYRDLEALGAAGVPVYTETGRHGGVRLVDGWRSRITGLTSEEADTLPLLGVPGAAAELGLGTVLAAAQLKVLAALPPELRGRASRVGERFHLDAPGWFRRGEDAPHLGEVAAAMWDDRRIAVRYRPGARAGRLVTRTLDPLGVVLKAGTWYLVAAHRGQPRTYRLSRIDSVERLAERAVRPEGFDLATHWAESSADFERTMHRMVVRVRVRADRAWLVKEALDPVAARAVTVELDPEDDRYRIATFPSESAQVALPHVLWLGAGAEVLSPPELRRLVTGEVAGMAARYASEGDASEAVIASASRAATAR